MIRAFILSFCLFLTLPNFAGGKSADHTAGEVIVKLVSGDERAISAFVSRIGAYSLERVFPNSKPDNATGLSNIYKLKFSAGADIMPIVHRCESDPMVEYAQPNYINRLCFVNAKDSDRPNDYFYSDQWALSIIEAQEAWKIEKGSRDVIIAVVDTGVDYKHEDLKERIWINPGEIPDNSIDDDGNGYIDDVRGWDFADSPDIKLDMDHIDRDNDPMDESGHGTHIAGIISAVPDNSVGIAGITWNCRIMAVRGGAKYLEDDDTSAGIVYAADNGARIINMSWGGEEFSYIIRDATKYAYNKGCVLVGAVGNDNQPTVIYPALHKHVIAVGATDRDDKKAKFSNYGAGVDIVAPGDRVFGTVLKNTYSEWSGTSMASPVVCGVVALMLSKRPSLTNEEVVQILRASADRIDEPLFSNTGRIDAVKALTTVSTLTAHITAPDNNEGANSEVEFRGTAAGWRFRLYMLEYSPISDLKNWSPISAPVEEYRIDSILGRWNVASLDEGVYVVRLRVFGNNGQEAEDRVILNIDHSPSKIIQPQVVTRLDGDRYRHVVKLETDDFSDCEVNYRKASLSEAFNRLSTGYTAKEHDIYIPDEIAPGIYEFFLKVINIAGLVTIDDNDGRYYQLRVNPSKVTTDGFVEIATGISAMYPISGEADFDGDGRLEIVGMERPEWQYSWVRIYEKNEIGAYEEVFKSSMTYFARDVGDTDGDGLLEILGNKGDTTFLFEPAPDGLYPTEKIWEISGIRGIKIADLDADGKREIICRRSGANEVQIYENRGERSYIRAARLSNPTDGGNYIELSFGIGDLDGDGRNEIVIGDRDGDVFIYENIADDMYSHTWTTNIPKLYIDCIATGDFDGDGVDEFIIAGESAKTYGQTVTQWIYKVFDSSNDDEYRPVWSLEIIGMKNGCGVTAGDVDNDGQDEIVIFVAPSLYIFKYSESDIIGDMPYFFCLWRHPASDTYRPVIADIDGDGANEVLFNDGNRLLSAKFDPRYFSPILRPWGLSATPLDESSVELRWNGTYDSTGYRIYRGEDDTNLRLISTLDLSLSSVRSDNRGTEPPFRDDEGSWEVIRSPDCADLGYFRDTGLKADKEYWYSIASLNSAGKESQRSIIASATPNSPPLLLSAQYAHPSTIFLDFNEPMGASAMDKDRYTVLSKEGFSVPISSALLDQHEKRVILTLINLTHGEYTVTVSNVRDATGVPIRDGSADFYVPPKDVTPCSDLSLMVVYPNPVMPNSRHPAWVTFSNLPRHTIIRIYNISGELIKTLDKTESDRSSRTWYLDNDENTVVASGIYIFIAECSVDRKTSKISIIR